MGIFIRKQERQMKPMVLLPSNVRNLFVRYGQPRQIFWSKTGSFEMESREVDLGFPEHLSTESMSNKEAALSR